METILKKQILVLWVVSIVWSSTTLGQWSDEGKILSIYPSSSHGGVLVQHERMPNPDGCPNSTQYVLDKNHMFFTEIFSLLMSAQARGSNMNLHVDGCGGFNNVYPVITFVVAK